MDHIRFGRLTEVSLEDVTALLNEPRLRSHMPLSVSMTPAEAARWVSAKESQWASNGYGPWAVWVDGQFAGWVGFEAETGGADFALVLLPAYWGRGDRVAAEALRRGFTDFDLSSVVISLPLSRTPDRAVARWGFVPDGEVVYDTTTFRRFRLTRAAWLDSARSDGPYDAGAAGPPQVDTASRVGSEDA